jgi:glycosyltransferase 2 family protein
MNKKWIGGLALSTLLVYLSLRGVDFREVADGFRELRYGYLGPALAGMLLMQMLRSYRWGLILRPLGTVGQMTLFSVTSVGFLAIIAIPARVGELARPYLITRKSDIPMCSAFGTIFVERVFDTLTVLIILLFVIFFTPLPPWLVRAGLFVLLLTMALLAGMALLIVKRDASLRFLCPLIARLPERYAAAVNRLLGHFIDGFGIIVDPGLFIAVSALSLVIWLVDVGIIHLLLLASGLQLPVTAAFVLMIVLIVGIAIPTAPGFIGNWHYFCILGLSLFAVPRAEALSFAIIYHFLSIGIIILLGLAFLPFNRFSLADLRRQADEI